MLIIWHYVYRRYPSERRTEMLCNSDATVRGGVAEYWLHLYNTIVTYACITSIELLLHTMSWPLVQVLGLMTRHSSLNLNGCFHFNKSFCFIGWLKLLFKHWNCNICNCLDAVLKLVLFERWILDIIYSMNFHLQIILYIFG